MTITQANYIDVLQKAEALNCNVPTGLAILPRNFEEAETKTELLHVSETATVRVLFRINEVEETTLELEGDNFLQISEKAFDGWIGPIIFMSLGLISENPHIISVALGVISNYLTDWFKGIPKPHNAKLEIVVETKKKNYKKIAYEGPVSGLEQLAQVVKEVSSND